MAHEKDVPVSELPASVDPANFPMKIIKVEDTGRAGRQRFVFKISVEDRAKYARHQIFAGEWGTLIGDFDRQSEAQSSKP